MSTISRLGVLGCGPMGTAIIEGALAGSVLPAASVLAVDRDTDRRAAMAALGCAVADDASALAACDTLLLAVRPQDFVGIGAAMAGDQPRLAVSVMAGLGSGAIAAALGLGTRVVRSMPNTAASIGKAVVAVAPGPDATDQDLAAAVSLMQGVGRVVQVDESQMHAVTAVSGSGPAWVYLLAEAVEAQALELGLLQDQVDVLLPGMLSGAAALLDADGRSPGALREAVTTPGGTTEAGLAAMQAAGFVEAVRAGVAAAHARGEALG